MKTVVIFLALLTLPACAEMNAIKQHNQDIVEKYYPNCVRTTKDEPTCRKNAERYLITQEDILKAMRPSTCYSTIYRSSRGGIRSGTSCI